MESLHNQPAPIFQEHIRTCDIILPTFKREESLRKTLGALHEQMIPTNWRVRIILCDDGAPSKAQSIINTFVWSMGWQQPILLSLTHGGRAGARNAGINTSSAEILLFLADDIILRAGSLAAHLRFHEDNTDIFSAALGWVLWDPRILPTPFMEWMTHGGQQNDYDSLLDKGICDAEGFFYGSHVSIKRALLGKERFSNAFTHYGWEDLELGSRLQKKGMKLCALQLASALHSHWYGAEELLERQRIIGAQKYKVNTKSARIVRHAVYQYSGMRLVTRLIMKMMGNKVNIPVFFQFVISGEFWYGVHHANRVLKRKSS